jgi:hypothetical protein
MKTTIAALALVTLAAGPTFAASSHARHVRRDFYLPQYDPNSLDFTDVIGGHHLDLNPPDPSGGIPGA